MADEPETPADVPDEPGSTAAPAQAGAAPAKMSQPEANYRESNKVQCCGLCPHWHDCEKNWGQCEVVEGEISCFGLCDHYIRGDNPFRQGETGEFTGGRPVAIPAFAGAAPAPSLAAMGGMIPASAGTGAPPRLRIGSKSYGG